MKNLNILANIFWILSLIIMVSIIKFLQTKLSYSAIILLNCIGYAFLLTSIILRAIFKDYEDFLKDKEIENNSLPVIKITPLRFLKIFLKFLLKVFFTLLTLLILLLSLLVTLTSTPGFFDMPT